MTFDEYWAALESKNGQPITGSVKLTAEGFRKMQKQAYEMGKKSMSIKQGDPFADLFRNMTR